MNDDDDDVERGPGDTCKRFVRNTHEEALFLVEQSVLTLTAYNCFDEEEGIELYWLKIGVSELRHFEHVWDVLQAWRKYDHSMVMRIRAMWKADGDAQLADEGPGCVNAVTDSFGRTSLRAYRQLHTRLGYPVIQKICRQLFKLLLHLADHTLLPIHKITAEDVNVHPVSCKVCLMPTFIWRDDAAFWLQDPRAEGTASSGMLAPWELERRNRNMLHTFARVAYEIFMGKALPMASASELRAAMSDLPNDDAADLLRSCLPEGDAPAPSASSLLESCLLDTRRLLHLPLQHTAIQEEAPVILHGDHLLETPDLLRSLDRRFSTIADTDSPTADPDGPDAAAGPGVAAAAIAAINEEADFKAGAVKGVDYDIAVGGELAASNIEFTIKLHQRNSTGLHPGVHLVRFPFDINNDTVDSVCEELAPLFDIEETDQSLTAAAMKEVMAELLPDMPHLWSSSRLSEGVDSLHSNIGKEDRQSGLRLPSDSGDEETDGTAHSASINKHAS